MLPFLGIKDYIYGAVILLLTASIIFLKLSLSSAQVENMRLEKQITSYDTAIAEKEIIESRIGEIEEFLKREVALIY